MTLLRALFGNAGLKLLSLLLAVSLWSLVRSDLEETKTYSPALLIEVAEGDNIDADLADNWGPGWRPEFDVVGPGSDVNDLLTANAPVRVRIGKDTLGERHDTVYPVKVSDIEFPTVIQTGKVRVVSMKPMHFDVAVWKLEIRTPAVEPDIEIEGLAELGENLTVVPVRSPSNITLRGRAAQMSDLLTVRIKLPRDQLANIERRDSLRIREEIPVTYALADKYADFEIVNPEELIGQVAVTYRDERVVSVPIRLFTEPTDIRKLVFPESNELDIPQWVQADPRVPGDPNQLKVRFEGSPAALRQLDDAARVAQIRAYVEGTEFPAGTTSKYLRVRFSGLPDGVIPAETYEVGVELR